MASVNLPGGLWLEPSAGDGAIIKAVNEVRQDVTWHANDIRPETKEQLQAIPNVGPVATGDYLEGPLWPTASDGYYEVCITNPPFSLAPRFVHERRDVAMICVMLLRVGFLGSIRRTRAWLPNDVPEVLVLGQRPSFVNGTTDASEYAWMIWGQQRRTRATISVLPALSPGEWKDLAIRAYESANE
jgi:hypothetical protein